MKRIKTASGVIGKLLLSFVLALGFIMIVGVVYSVIAIVNGANPNELTSSIQENKWISVIQFVAFIGVSFAMYAWFERKKGWSLGIKQQKAGILTVHGLLAGIILISVSAIIIWLVGGISWKLAEFNQELVISLLGGILLFIGVALSEEIFSRGYVQGLLRYHYGPTVAIIVSSVLFSLMHSMNPAVFSSPFPILNIILAGVIMAVARELTGGIWWPVGLHLTWNFFQGYVYGFQVSGTDPVPSVLQATDNGPSAISGGAFGAEGSLVSVIVLLLGITAVYYFYRGKNRTTNQSLTQ